MQRAANDVMQSILFSAVLDAIAALKAGSGGLPNNLLRDVQAIHSNVTLADLPKAVQDAIAASTRAAFTQLLKEGYAVGPKGEMRPATRPLDRVPERDRRAPGERREVRDGAGRRGPPRPDGEGPRPGPRGPGAPGQPHRRGGRPPKGKPRLS